MNITKQLGYLALGTRFKLLTDRLLQDVDRIYKNLGMDFEPRWFMPFYLINNRDSVSVTEIANELGYTQPAVTQTLNILIDKGLVKSVKEKEDSRKKSVTVTPKGKTLYKQLEPVWKLIEKSVREFFLSTGYDILSVIGKIESELDKKDIYTRISESIKENQLEDVEIIHFDPAYRDHFRDLNYNWIDKFFTIEDADKIMLENPESEILEKGGFIIFAGYNSDIVGTGALIKHPDSSFELAKMAVKEDLRGKQIGRKIALALIDIAKKQNAAEIFLETNPTMTIALNLYRKLGFEEVEMAQPSKYSRSTIRMNLRMD